MRTIRVFLSISILMSSGGPGVVGALAATRSRSDSARAWTAPAGVLPVRPELTLEEPAAVETIAAPDISQALDLGIESPTLQTAAPASIRPDPLARASDENILKGIEKAVGEPAHEKTAEPVERTDSPALGRELFDGEVPIAVRVRGDDPERLLAALSAEGFHANESGARPAGLGAWTAVGSIPESALGRLAENVPAVDGLLDLSQLERVQGLGSGQTGRWSELLNADAELQSERRSLLTRAAKLDLELRTHNAHALLQQEIDEHNRLAAQTRRRIEENDRRLDDNERRQAANREAIRAYRLELEAAAQSHLGDLSLDEPGGRGVGLNLWTPPSQFVPPSGAQPNSVKAVKGIPIRDWAYFYAHGFELSKDADKPVKVVGRLTGKEIPAPGIGIEGYKVVARVERREGPQNLDRDQIMQWLEVEEISLVQQPEPPAAPALSEAENAAAEAGAKLLSWGVPPHILDNSQDVITETETGEKRKVSLSPDAKFFFFKQGVPIATPAGGLLVQLLERLEHDKPGAAAKLSAIELQGLAYILERQAIPWWTYKPEQAPQLMDQLYARFRDKRLIRPLIEEPLGINLHPEPAQSLREYLAEQLGVMQSRIEWGGGAQNLHNHAIAQAARFAWTLLSAPNDYATIVHREGLAFLKQTGWRRSSEIWRLMPMGETVLYMGLDSVLQRIVDQGIKGSPLAVADAGWADIFHPDNVDVVLIDRSGNRVEHHEFYNLPDAPKKSGGGDSVSKADDGKKKAKAAAKEDETPQPKAGPVMRGREHLRIDDPATAVATIMQLVASALGTFVVSIDLPGFSGDKDIVPPGVDKSVFFADELARAETAAIDRWGVGSSNFSWGGGLGDTKAQSFLNKKARESGVAFVAAAGNSGPGLAQQRSPTFADEVIISGGEDNLGSKAGFTSGIGFMETIDGVIRFGPDYALPAGYDGANSLLAPIAENPDVSIVSHFQRYIHIRGTSFSDPANTATLTALYSIAAHLVAGLGQSQALNDPAFRLALWRAAKDSLSETAQMLPGVLAVYSGNGRVRLADAVRALEEKARALAANYRPKGSA